MRSMTAAVAAAVLALAVPNVVVTAAAAAAVVSLVMMPSAMPLIAEAVPYCRATARPPDQVPEAGGDAVHDRLGRRALAGHAGRDGDGRRGGERAATDVDAEREGGRAGESQVSSAGGG
jgi:hypothetical protein